MLQLNAKLFVLCMLTICTLHAACIAIHKKRKLLRTFAVPASYRQHKNNLFSPRYNICPRI